MTIANKTVVQLDAAYVACTKLAKALEDYHQGKNRPSVQLGRFTVAETNALVTAAKSAVDAIAAA